VSEPERIAGEWLESIGIMVEPQKRIGTWCFDYFIPSAYIVVEIDGAFWHSSEKVKERDKRKNNAVAEMGYKMIRVDAEEVRKNPSLALYPIAKIWMEATGATFAQVAEDKTNANAAA
jgi:very-short-patch-repair endonuclease